MKQLSTKLNGRTTNLCCNPDAKIAIVDQEPSIPEFRAIWKQVAICMIAVRENHLFQNHFASVIPSGLLAS